MDLHLSISNGFVSSKIYDKRDDFDFDKVNFPFLDGDVPRRPSYGVYISQLIRFARVCSHVDDFNTRNKCLTAKLLKQGYRYHKLKKAFSKFYRRHYELISKFNFGLKSLLHQCLSEPEFYGDLNRDYINQKDSRPTVGRFIGRSSADLSADKMPDFSSFFIGRQKINYNYLVIIFFPSADSFGVLAIGR